MRLLLLGVCLALISTSSLALQPGQPIVVEKRGLGQFYKQDGDMLKLTDLETLLQDNPAAYQEFQAARKIQTPALILAGAGGALIGWPVGTAAGGGEAHWGMAGIGAVLAAGGIYLGTRADARLGKAVEIYNRNVGARLGVDVWGRDKRLVLRWDF